MSVCSRSDNNKSKAHVSVRSGINVSVRSYINTSKSDLLDQMLVLGITLKSVCSRSDIRVSIK